jgi:hypothetical protein
VRVVTDALETARAEEYRARLVANRLRRALYEHGDVDETALNTAEDALAEAERIRQAAEAADQSAGVLFDTHKTLGRETTGLEAKVTLRMEHVPTAVAHLLRAADHPLVEVAVHNTTDKTQRVRVTAYVDGFSATAVETAEIKGQQTEPFLLLPILHATALAGLTELTRASLNLLVEDLDKARVEIHRAVPIWLLARSTAPLAVLDSKTGDWVDMTEYFAAFVTPNAPSVQAFLSRAAERHPARQLVGYQDGAGAVEPQIQAMFEALHEDGDLRYVQSVLTTSPREGFADQRVRVPRESLADRQANCIDGAVLYASLIEAASMSPAIVVVPQHAFVGWETSEDSGQWAYLETTMTGGGDFRAARERAEGSAARYMQRGELVRHSVATLRAHKSITPLE